MSDPTPAELEAMADAMLLEDAREKGYIKGEGRRGFTKYAREYGMLTADRLETVYKHELAVSFINEGDDFTQEEKLEFMDRISSDARSSSGLREVGESNAGDPMMGISRKVKAHIVLTDGQDWNIEEEEDEAVLQEGT